MLGSNAELVKLCYLLNHLGSRVDTLVCAQDEELKPL
jgi:hypothetical protein